MHGDINVVQQYNSGFSPDIRMLIWLPINEKPDQNVKFVITKLNAYKTPPFRPHFLGR